MLKFSRLMIGFKFSLLVLSCVATSFISGCGMASSSSGSANHQPGSGPANAVSVAINSISAPAIKQAGNVILSATVGNDPEAQGVTWLLTGVGTIVSTDKTATYTAPKSVKGSVNVTVMATSIADSSKTATIRISVTSPIATTACATEATGNESELAANSQYAFFFQGFQGPGSGLGITMAGSITTDGAGSITTGEEDLNVSSGPQHLTVVPASSAYSVGPDNRGCLALAFSGGTPAVEVFHFTVGGIAAGTASRGRIIEFDDNSETQAGTRGSGIIRLQDASSFAIASLQPRYAFGMDGVDSVGAHVAMGGAFGVDNTTGSITNGFLDVDDGGLLQSGVSGATGTIATTATTTATGRETLSLAWTSGSQNDAIYIVNADEFFVVQIDPTDGLHPIIAGRAITTGTTFSAASLSGSYIFHNSGAVAGAADVTLGFLTFAGGSVNGALATYTAAGGSTLNAVSGGTYTVDASNSGRATLAGAGANPPVLYLATPSANTETLPIFTIGTSSTADFGFGKVSRRLSIAPAPCRGTSSLRRKTRTTTLLMPGSGLRVSSMSPLPVHSMV